MFVLQPLEGRLFFLQPDVIVFCQFPFVLDVQAKADLMKYESKLNMQVGLTTQHVSVPEWVNVSEHLHLYCEMQLRVTIL